MKREGTARLCAAELLHAVLERGHEMERAFAAHPGVPALSARDRNFCRLLVATALRRLGEIDALLARYLQRPLPAKLFHVKHCMRLGVVQLLVLGTPPHAAVHDTVELLAAARWRRHKGLVNAVLQRTAREGKKDMEALARPGINTPGWLWESWSVAYGAERAALIERAHLQTPPLDLSVKSAAERIPAGESPPTGGVRLREQGRVEELEGYDSGAWWVQDAAAALPARLLGAVAGREVLELCAAPGGKTAQLAAAGAQVTAVERSPQRIAALRDNLARLGLKAETVQADAMKWEPGRAFEFILLDAPCSATGTLRRHPDVARRRGPEDVARLAEIQRALLDRAGGWLAPGGRLVYCVCSLQPEEGEGQAAAFLARHPEFARLPVAADEVGGCAELLTPEGDLRTLPCHWEERGGMDGFFAARFIRKISGTGR